MTELDREHPAPPIGEEIHLPGPSLLPILNAAGLTLAIVGITFSIIVVIIGAALFLGTAIRWIADSRRELESLPAEHTTHS